MDLTNISPLEWFFLTALLAIWLMLLYHILLVYGGYRYFLTCRNNLPPAAAPDQYPSVSILVPAHNEELVIGRTVDAIMSMDYPRDKIELIVINDSSTDRTGEILAARQKLYPQLQVLTIKPPLGAKGKSNALNQGLKLARGELIAVYDADNTPEKPALRRLVETMLADPRLGAVVGMFRTRNRNKNILTRFINIEGICFQWMVQAGRFHWFGMSTIPGTNFIVRKAIMDQIGGWASEALTEDTEMTVRIYEQGYLIRWVPYSVTWEQEPETLRVWIKQRTRWSRGNLWVVFHYLQRPWRIKNRRILVDLIYFFFTYVFFFTFVIISDIIFVLGLLGQVSLTLQGPYQILWLLAYSLFVVETYIALNMERSEGTAQNLFLIMLMYFTYCQLWLLVVLRAMLLAGREKIAGQKTTWYKTERTAG